MLINAKEAFKMSRESKIETKRQEVAAIAACIEEATSKGEYSIRVSLSDMSETTADILKEEGYTVNKVRGLNFDCCPCWVYEVKWEEV